MFLRQLGCLCLRGHQAFRWLVAFVRQSTRFVNGTKDPKRELLAKLSAIKLDGARKEESRVRGSKPANWIGGVANSEEAREPGRQPTATPDQSIPTPKGMPQRGFRTQARVSTRLKPWGRQLQRPERAPDRTS
jgi:hypothetical protein